MRKGRQRSSTQIADGGDVADVLTVQLDPSHSSYLPFWGKARGGVHPLWMHSLDVAAVGYQLARLRRRTFAALERLGWEVQDLQALWTVSPRIA